MKTTQKQQTIEGLALFTAVAAGTTVAMSAITLARGESRGAPGMSHGLSRLGSLVGGGMMSGVGLVGASSALTALGIYRSVKLLDR
jgi:hypothetical protein